MDRDCKNCVYSNMTEHSNGCTRWNCEYINIDEAVKAWKFLHNNEKLIGDQMEELIKEMEETVADVNVNEIADHLKEESLWNWCGAWRGHVNRILKDMKKEISYDLQD